MALGVHARHSSRACANSAQNQVRLSQACQSLSQPLTFVGHTPGMSTSQGAPYVLTRVAARAGLGVWRHRVAVLVAAIVSVGLGSYAMTSVSSGLPSLVPTSASTACADT